MKKDTSTAAYMLNPITKEKIGMVGVKYVADPAEIKAKISHATQEEEKWSFESFKQIKTIKGNELDQKINDIGKKGAMMNFSEFFSYMKDIEEIDIKSVIRPVNNIAGLVNGKGKLQILKLENIENLEAVHIEKGLSELNLKDVPKLKKLFGLDAAEGLKKLSITSKKQLEVELFESVTKGVKTLVNRNNSLEEITVPFHIAKTFDIKMVDELSQLSKNGLKLNFLDESRYAIDLDMIRSLVSFKERFVDKVNFDHITDIEKMALAHVYLMENVTYAHEKLKKVEEVTNNLIHKIRMNKKDESTIEEIKRARHQREKLLLTTQTGHAALINNESVCEGYASGFVFLLNIMNMKGCTVDVAAGEGSHYKKEKGKNEYFQDINETGRYHAIAKGICTNGLYKGKEYYFDPTWDAGKKVPKYFALTKEQIAKTHRFGAENVAEIEEISDEVKQKAITNALCILLGKEREYEAFEIEQETLRSVRQMKHIYEKARTARYAAIKSGNKEKASRMFKTLLDVGKMMGKKKMLDYGSMNTEYKDVEGTLDEIMKKTQADKVYYFNNIKCGVQLNETEGKVVVTTRKQDREETKEMYVLDEESNAIVAKYGSKKIVDVEGQSVNVVESEETGRQYYLNVKEKSVKVYCKNGIYENKIVHKKKHEVDMDFNDK